MKITFIEPTTGKTKKVKFGFNWVIFSFGQIYAIPFFYYGLYIFGLIFLATVLVYTHYIKAYFNALIENPAMIFEFGKTTSYDTAPLIISSAANLILLFIGGIYGNRMIARKYIKKGWKIVEPNETIMAEINNKWNVSVDDFYKTEPE